MRLPDAQRAVVEDAKVRDYLLAPEHPVGRFKARVFTAAGYHALHWQRLQDDLRLLARSIDVTLARRDAFGDHFVGVGALAAPSGRPLPVVTVWLISSAGAAPRLITAYPHEGA
jgi:hypothetical protein